MKERKTRTVGSGITKRDKAIPLDVTPENSAEIIDSFDRFHKNMHRPWGGQKALIDEARKRLEEIEAEAPSIMDDLDGFNAHFKPHASPGWYCLQIDVCAKIAEMAVEGGRPWEAVFRAIQIGSFATELDFKERWEEDALAGKRLNENRLAANQARRLGPAEERCEKVDYYVGGGHSKERAYHLAANDLNVSPSTIKKEYLKQRKLDQSVD